MRSPWARTLFWLAVIALIVVSIHVLSAILLPFALALALAFFLNPVVERMETAGMSRALATLLVLFCFGLCMVALGVLLVPLLEVQVVRLINHFPEYLAAANRWLNNLAGLVQQHVSTEEADRIRNGRIPRR